MNTDLSEVRYLKANPDGGVWHEYANLFPMLSGDALEAFDADVKQNGVREPIVFYQGKILDGRNRYMAARNYHQTFPCADYLGDDPLGFVWSLNGARRHLSESQRSMIAAKIANMRQGERNDLPAIEGKSVSQEQAAELVNVSVASVERAAKVVKDGSDELIAAVETGQVSVSAAAVITELPKDEQSEVVARGEKEILLKAKEINAGKATARRAQRIERIAEISKGNAELGTATKYPVIYADPPWRYENPPIGSTSRAIENHYPTMTLEEICALPVRDLAADDAILYMWATAPKLAECMKVLEAWGFEYRTNAVWDKDVIGMGYHFRNQHEILLVAKRGELPPPVAGTQPSSVYRERRTEHSAKPDYYRDLIAGFYPTLPRIELFCRSAPEGWDVWGNQSGATDAA